MKIVIDKKGKPLCIKNLSGWALRYAAMYQAKFVSLSKWKQETILGDMNGRHAQEFAKEIIHEAETESVPELAEN